MRQDMEYANNTVHVTRNERKCTIPQEASRNKQRTRRTTYFGIDGAKYKVLLGQFSQGLVKFRKDFCMHFMNLCALYMVYHGKGLAFTYKHTFM